MKVEVGVGGDGGVKVEVGVGGDGGVKVAVGVGNASITTRYSFTSPAGASPPVGGRPPACGLFSLLVGSSIDAAKLELLGIADTPKTRIMTSGNLKNIINIFRFRLFGER